VSHPDRAAGLPRGAPSAIINDMQPEAEVRAAFTEPEAFWSSPLYRRLSKVVAEDPQLVRLAAHTRAGQVPTFALFGAVQYLLLAGCDDPLAGYYPSIRGDRARPPDHELADHFRQFTRRHRPELIQLLTTRLVQTNQVQRALGLRLGLHVVGRDQADRGRAGAVHLLEIGTSAGLVLRQAAYGYHLGGCRFGRPDSPVQLRAEWRSAEPVPDLDQLPDLASTTGLDLNPLSADDPEDRRWLEALVWPEDRAKALLLDAALDLAAELPLPILAGDAQHRCADWAADLPDGQTRVVFHCATRMHVPGRHRPAFDQAIADVGRRGPLYRIAIEGAGLVVIDPDGVARTPYDVNGHLEWVAPAAGLG